MRLSCLALTLALAVPALAADRTETLVLRHLPAAELERILVRIRHPPPRRERRRSWWKRDLSRGIGAWTVDTERNGLAVTGTREAIRQLKAIVTLVDIPAPARAVVRGGSLTGRRRGEEAGSRRRYHPGAGAGR